MSETKEFDLESSVIRIEFVFVLSTKADVKYLLNISVICLEVSAVDLVLCVSMESSSGMRFSSRSLSLELNIGVQHWIWSQYSQSQRIFLYFP